MPRFRPGRLRFGKYVWAYADWASFMSAFRQIMVEGWYAYDREIVARSPMILDCGANIGLASLYFAARSPRAKIVAFEPDPALFRLLKENLERNLLTGRVDAVNAALWVGSAHEAPFVSDGADSGYLNPFASGGVKVTTVRLRDFIKEPVGLLKMDIEGAEVDVLQDSVELLSNVHQIIIEHHSIVSQPQRLGEFLNILERAGFRLQINNVHRWMNPLVQSPCVDRFDQLLTVYGYRL
jgi:FkbM family methyltransferase